ncbi:LSU ribosomal protein L25P [Stanieria cyanosphaera PCC 7437]|uniref:Large ribosomal subunit protein bL25 n=1 Tax=Stanieria cyanosphaera (strain ATCC 29371 / PCC 7437) TaxID=111780 RepID=K9XWY0_STAC7|nr:50S ribosomal protein L25/general stress protein Ctc [Stanieria cyanosphaera]AFZ37043.1 LSU ribosomal protein L25P [Stanieria cyanosphaera PCC 7437]
MSITVECQKRPEGSKPNALRREGFIPAALYGHNGTESVSLTIDAKDAQTLLKNAAVNNTLVDLSIPELPWNGKALIREVQVHPWKKTLHHLSFFSVAAHGTLELVVPIKIVGEAAGIKQGGILEQMMTELNISCTAENIPESIEINISQFEIGSNLTVGDVILSEGVTALDESDRIVVAIVPPAKAEPTAEEEAAVEA